MCDPVDAKRQAADDGHAILSEAGCQTFRYALAIAGGVPGANNCHRKLIRRQKLPAHIQHCGGLVDLSQQPWIVRRVPRQYVYVQVLEALHLRLEIQPAAQIQQLLDGRLVQACRTQRDGTGMPGRLQIGKIVQQSSEAHRPDPGHQVEADPEPGIAQDVATSPGRSVDQTLRNTDRHGAPGDIYLPDHVFDRRKE